MERNEEGQSLLPLGGLVAGRYRLEAHLGEGGVGPGTRVRDGREGRLWALKRLRAKYGSSSALPHAHFAREYHTLAQLAHPCIIEVYDYGVADGTPYYTMELLDGQDLRERGRLP